LRLSGLQREAVVRLIEAHAVKGGGFSPMSGEPFRSDATAWGILALRQIDLTHALLGSARDRLAAAQEQDGRVTIGNGYEEVFWPTALCTLAWSDSQAHDRHRDQGLSFLLKTTGYHRPRAVDDQAGHDPSILGWPWVGGTHSWIEPTSLAIIALRKNGRKNESRVHQAIDMLLDRQLPSGGWNYGNPSAFGKELHPMPESTGAALVGLSGVTSRTTVNLSLEYLLGVVRQLRTPVSLGWALLGLGAWDVRPSFSQELVERSLSNQARYGEYDMSSLCILLLGAMVGKGEEDWSVFVAPSGNPTRLTPS